jgi:hypothetical protein
MTMTMTPRIPSGARRLLAVSALGLLAAIEAAAQGARVDDPLAIRQELTAVNSAWSAARLAYDSAKAESMLLPTFYAALRDRRMTRDEFVRAVSTRSPAATLVRFDNPILTIMKGDSADEWVALVLEKLEVDRTAPDGTRTRTYSLWITRDGYRRIGPDRWQLAYSWEVMRESWTGGRKPPFPDWE